MGHGYVNVDPQEPNDIHIVMSHIEELSTAAKKLLYISKTVVTYATAHHGQRHREPTGGGCVLGVPDVSTSNVIRRAQRKMKMRCHLFKNHFKMTTEH